MPDIFISYAREDKAIARRFVEAFEQHSWTVWWDQGISIGKPFDNETDMALASAKCVVVLWSKDSILSDWVRTEASEGASRRILLPVLIDDISPPLQFRLIQTAYLVNWNGDFSHPDLHRLMNSIAEMLDAPPLPAKAPVARMVIGENTGSLIRDLNHGEKSSSPILPWRSLPPSVELDVFRLLDWRVRLTPLVGRDADRRELLEWAQSDADILVRFLVGPGGAGKSRLAIEVADALRMEGWTAGQVFLDRPCSLLMSGKGLFLVVDYPEACRPQVSDLLRDLARVEQAPTRIRVLLLSRLVIKDWHSVIDAAAAASICDAQDVKIGPLATETAIELFSDAVRRFAEHRGQPAPHITDDAIKNWLDQDRETHQLPLFILAAALHYTWSNTDELSLTGAQIVEALVRREQMRLDNVGQRANWGERAVSRIVGLATVSGGLDAAAIRRLAAERELGLPMERSLDAIRSLGFWKHDRVPAPSPDIVAAELLFQVLNDCADEAQVGAWLWACLASTASQNVDRLGRVAYDIATLRGPTDFKRFASWLAIAINEQPQRANEWRAISEEDRLPLGLLPLAVAIGKALLKSNTLDKSERADILNSLSNRLSDTGDTLGALEASREAVNIYSELADMDPERYMPGLAQGLCSLSICLRDEQNSKGALEASRAAVEIYRELSDASPMQYEPYLARSLRILSICLGENDINDRANAIDVIREAVAMYRRLAEANPARYDADLAQSLNTLAVDLSETGDQEGALNMIYETVAIWRRLATSNPARYEPGLALALNNLSHFLRESGDGLDALNEIRAAIKIYGRIAAANPARYEPDLVRSLENLSRELSDAGNPDAAANALREAVDIQRKLVAANPARYELGLAQRLDRLSRDLSDPVNAVNAIQAYYVAQTTVVILLMRGENPDGHPIYAYVAVRADKLESFMEAQTKGMFYPEDYGVIIESGEGEPSLEVQTKMETEYGFNHEGMITIPNPEKAYEIVTMLTPPEEDE